MKIYNYNTYINNTSYAKKIEKVLINSINYKLRNSDFYYNMLYIIYSMTESTRFGHNVANNRCIKVSFDSITGLKGRYAIDRLVVTEKTIKRIISYDNKFDFTHKNFIIIERRDRTKHIFIKLGKLVSPLTMMP